MLDFSTLATLPDLPIKELFSSEFICSQTGAAAAATAIAVYGTTRVLKKTLRRLAYREDYIVDPSVGAKFKVVGKKKEPGMGDIPALVAEMRASFDSGYPILWVTPVKDMDEAIAHVARQPKSLSSYVFSGDRSVADRISQNTCAGGVTVNAVIFHCGHPELPFGGVGTSGMGNYHGTETFHCFTHKKPVLHKTTFPLPGLSDPFVLYQPWSNFKIKALRFLMAWA